MIPFSWRRDSLEIQNNLLSSSQLLRFLGQISALPQLKCLHPCLQHVGHFGTSVGQMSLLPQNVSLHPRLQQLGHLGSIRDDGTSVGQISLLAQSAFLHPRLQQLGHFGTRSVLRSVSEIERDIILHIEIHNSYFNYNISGIIAIDSK